MHWSVFTDPNSPNSESLTNRRIISSASLLVGTLCLITSPFLIMNDADILGWLLIPIAAVYYLVVVLNQTGWHVTALWVLFLNFNVGTYFYLGFLGHGLGLEYLFLASILASQLIFKSMLTKAMAALIAISLVVIGDFSLFIQIEPLELSVSSQIWLRVVMLPGALIIILFAIIASYARYDQRVQAMAKTIQMARTDELTQLGNRFSFKQDQIHKVITQTPECCLILLDLDGLKAINDEQGHSTGDDFLQVFSTLVKDHFPEGRHYRFGGDEFVIWVQNPVNTTSTLKAVKTEIQNYQKYTSSVSYGVSYGNEVTCIGDMIDLADKRMYAQKKATYMAAS